MRTEVGTETSGLDALKVAKVPPAGAAEGMITRFEGLELPAAAVEGARNSVNLVTLAGAERSTFCDV